MFKVALINMPFGAVHIPSLGLTQLRAKLDREFGNSVQTDIFYLNHDFSQFFGLDLYRYLSDDSRTTVTGFTDWVFQPLAFPVYASMPSKYLSRYNHTLACRCEDGRRKELDGCSASPSPCSNEASTVPCCLEPDVLSEIVRKQADMGQFMDSLIDRYGLAEFQLVGFTSMFDQTVASIALASRIKSRNSSVTTVLGGASCEPGVGRVLSRCVDVLDYVFVGPALSGFPKMVRNLMEGESYKCKQIRGVYCSENQEESDFCDPGIGEESDINDRLTLNYDDFLTSARNKCPEVIPELFFETSRGCWWGERAHCTFCGINGATMKFRAMSSQNAVSQFHELFERYPSVKRFVAVDNILDLSYYSSVFPFVKAPEGASIFYETRVINSEEHMRTLAEAGVTRIQPGIEALSTSVLRLMKKGTTAFQNIAFLKKIFTFGIEVEWNLLTGFPNEDEQVYSQYLRTIPSLVHLPAPVATFPVRFDSHSPYHQTPSQYNLDLRPVDFYSMVYPFSDEELRDMAYYWSDHNLSNRYLFNLARWQRKIENAVDYWRERWYQRDEKLKPQLKFLEDSETVYDTRSGSVVEHTLSCLALKMLEHLDEPRSRSELQKAFDANDEEIDAELAVLNQCNMLFNESGRMMSLVTRGAPIDCANVGLTHELHSSDVSGETRKNCSGCKSGCVNSSH